MTLTEQIINHFELLGISISLHNPRGRGISFYSTTKEDTQKLDNLKLQHLIKRGLLYTSKNKKDLLNDLEVIVNDLKNTKETKTSTINTNVGDIDIEVTKPKLEDSKESDIFEIDLNMIDLDKKVLTKAIKTFCKNPFNEYIDSINNIELALVDNNEIFCLLDSYVFYIKCSKKCLKDLQSCESILLSKIQSLIQEFNNNELSNF
jgi:hypothetical protein